MSVFCSTVMCGLLPDDDAKSTGDHTDWVYGGMPMHRAAFDTKQADWSVILRAIKKLQFIEERLLIIICSFGNRLVSFDSHDLFFQQRHLP